MKSSWILPHPPLPSPVGFQNSDTGLDLGFYAARSYSLMRPQERAALDPLTGEVADGVVGPGRAECVAAVGRRR
jgi:hypothetical protein